TFSSSTTASRAPSKSSSASPGKVMVSAGRVPGCWYTTATSRWWARTRSPSGPACSASGGRGTRPAPWGTALRRTARSCRASLRVISITVSSSLRGSGCFAECCSVHAPTVGRQLVDAVVHALRGGEQLGLGGRQQEQVHLEDRGREAVRPRDRAG